MTAQRGPCTACGRPESPDHDADAPGPTVRHIYRPPAEPAAPDHEGGGPAPTCSCTPCTSGGTGHPTIQHCAACCFGTLIAEYDHDCPIAEHRAMAVQQFPTDTSAAVYRLVWSAYVRGAEKGPAPTIDEVRAVLPGDDPQPDELRAARDASPADEPSPFEPDGEGGIRYRDEPPEAGYGPPINLAQAEREGTWPYGPVTPTPTTTPDEARTVGEGADRQRAWTTIAPTLPAGYGDRQDEAIMALVELADGTTVPGEIRDQSLRRSARTALGLLAAAGLVDSPADYGIGGS